MKSTAIFPAAMTLLLGGLALLRGDFLTAVYWFAVEMYWILPALEGENDGD